MQQSRIIRNTFYAQYAAFVVASLTQTIGPIVDGVIIGRYLGVDAMAAFGIISPLMIIFSLAGAVASSGARSRFTAFMGQGKQVHTEKSEAVAYVDGSYNIATKEYSYGMLIYVVDDKYEAAESFSDPEMSEMRNVAGEIEGSMHAMKYCLDKGIKSIDIYYDYAGIEKWALGEWKTNKEGTKAYKSFYDSIKDKLEVHFHKVKGHSGDAGNDRADALAKSALGIQ